MKIMLVARLDLVDDIFFLLIVSPYQSNILIDPGSADALAYRFISVLKTT